MLFFSGFSLRDEKSLFNDFINDSDYCVSGFSYGAIKAFEHTKNQLKLGKRIDTLQLLSPAFFQTKSEKFKRLQILSYSKNKDEYMKQFIGGCFYPFAKRTLLHVETHKEELSELLNYEWNMQELQEMVDKGVKLEVYLGSKDAIIDVKSAREFFLQVATVTYIKDANHFLQTN